MSAAESRLSKPTSKAGRVQRVVNDLLLEHERGGGLPTNNRFVFYELEQAGNARKPDPADARPNRRRSPGWPPGAQDVNDALTQLRELGVVPWTWLVDEERRLAQWAFAASVAEYVNGELPLARINPWGSASPPLILCESKATAGVLEDVAAEYVCPIAGTKGQARGFLITVVAPALRGNERPVLYLGDLDRCGGDIEANTRRVLEREAVRELDWTRLGITEEQTAKSGIAPIWKVDGRDGKGHYATELESLGQAGVVQLVRDALDKLLPEPLNRVLEREDAERQALSAFLSTWKPVD